MTNSQEPRRYRKSTKSGGSGGNCVEWAHSSTGTYIRDSKDPHGPELRVTPAEWSTLIAAIGANRPHPWISQEPTGVRLAKAAQQLTFTLPEWEAFRAGILVGECEAVPALRGM
jgi:hypothetical protein